MRKKRVRKVAVLLGADATESVRLAAWLSAPEVPVKVTVALPVVADVAAVNVTCCGVPGVSVKAPGEIVTFDGTPLDETETCPEKPFNAVALTDTVDELPAVTLTLLGETVS